MQPQPESDLSTAYILAVGNALVSFFPSPLLGGAVAGGNPAREILGTTFSRPAAVEAALLAAENMVRTPRMFEDADTSAVSGTVHWSPRKSLWIGFMTLAALIGGPLCFTWSAFALFLATTATTICLGHSLGMHRRLIHRSFDCPLWLERLFVYLGTLVGMAGPFGMIRQHDIRDWAQRKAHCHPYLAHRSTIARDCWWQLHSELRLEHPPELVVEPRVAADPFYRFLERTWMAQQLPWAILFYALGGLPWLIWGIPRCSRSTTLCAVCCTVLPSGRCEMCSSMVIRLWLCTSPS